MDHLLQRLREDVVSCSNSFKLKALNPNSIKTLNASPSLDFPLNWRNEKAQLVSILTGALKTKKSVFCQLIEGLLLIERRGKVLGNK